MSHGNARDLTNIGIGSALTLAMTLLGTAYISDDFEVAFQALLGGIFGLGLIGLVTACIVAADAYATRCELRAIRAREDLADESRLISKRLSEQADNAR